MIKLDKLIKRLNKLNIILMLYSNYPWLYIYTINGKEVTETFDSEHDFVLGIRQSNYKVKLSNRKEIFKLIRKYI